MEKMETDFNEEEDEESTPSLLEFMPPGVLLEVFKFLEWNDLCQVSRTCTKFRDICQSATLWLQLRCLDFRNCSIPDGDKILKILQRTTNADTLILADVITDQTAQQHQGIEEEEENIVGPDKFLLNVLRTCHHVRNLTLYMHEITDRAVEAISAKCTRLGKLCIHDNLYIQNQSVVDMVSASETLTSLYIENCRSLSFLPLKHTDPTKQLKLTHVSLIGQEMVLQNAQDLILGCPCLTHLDLSLAQHLQSFNGGLSRGVKTAMDSLIKLTLLNCDDLLEISLPYCPNLNILDARNCRRLEEITATVPLLQNLQVSGCQCINKVELLASDLREFHCADSEDLETLQLGTDNLLSLDVAYCTRLDAEQLVSCVTNKLKLRDLNIEGCKGIPPVDLDEKILPIFSGLESLVYGGHSWSSVRLKSNTLKKLTFTTCINTTGLPLNMPELQELTLSKCRDFSEQDIIDGLLYGKLIPQKIMSVEILKDESLITPPFTGNTGTPALNVLKLHGLPGLHGEVISHWLKSFSHLTVLELVRCNFVTHLLIEDLPILIHLKLESCTRLNKLQVNRIQTLETLDVRWCSMVQSMEVSGENLNSLDLVGTNFAHLTINCDKLTSLHLAGVCTQPEHTICLRCQSLRELSIVKCDRLSDRTISDIIQHCPVIESLTLVGSLSLGSLSLSSTMLSCSLTGHRVLREISVANTVQIKHLTLNNLPKFTPADRQILLQHCEGSLKELEVRAIRGETDLRLSMKYLTSLTLDQGIQLAHLNINCPRLQYLRIQGCPKLQELNIQLEKLSQLQVYHSTPLLALRCLELRCKRAAHLARVLSNYCPKLEELTLRKCSVEFKLFDQLCQALPQLQTVNMRDCDVLHVPSQQRHFVIERTKDSSSKSHLVVNLVR